MLSTLGPNPKRILSPSDQSEKRCDFTLESMTALQVDLSLSNRQTLRAAQHIRAATGSCKTVEKGFKPKMRANNKHLSDYFETKKCVFCYINKKNRKIQTSILLFVKIVKIGMDGGGGLLKLVVWIFELNDDNGKVATKGAQNCSNLSKIQVLKS